MCKNLLAFKLIALLLTSAVSTAAQAGLTISDRRYWPSEARESPGRGIEIHPSSSADPGSAGVLASPHILPRGKARRPR